MGGVVRGEVAVRPGDHCQRLVAEDLRDEERVHATSEHVGRSAVPEDVGMHSLLPSWRRLMVDPMAEH
jgi:hypothetical protein